MKKVFFFLFVGFVALTVAGVGCSSSEPDYQTPSPQQITTTPTTNLPTSSSTSGGQVYENDYMKVILSDGWVATPVASKPAEVNITKGNYILFINTQAKQTSGVEGGRQGEITSSVPSADAVITDQPNECGTSDKQPVYEGYFRADLFMDSQTKKSGCKAPAKGTVWFFSYITDSRGGYFNYYPGENLKALVITMAYNSKDINKLPVKGSAELDSMVTEMTNIAKTLVLKKK